MPHPDLLLAAEHDAAGRYNDAINALACGTRAGDVECTTRLGMRLLTGDRAPPMPAEGLQFLADAWAMGSGEAANRAAAVLALGVLTPPNWNLAREWLVKAAEKDSVPAQQQLLVLCDDPELVVRAKAAANPLWKQLAAAIDLDAWRRSPPLKILSDNPRVGIFPGFLTPGQCDVMMGFAAGRLERALVYNPNSQQNIVDAHRSNTLAKFGTDSIEFLQVLVQARMSAATGIPLPHFEPLTELHYAVGERITNHFDFVDPNITHDYAGEIARNGQRIITFIVYLNDDYDGGETTFDQLGITHKGAKGQGIYFVNALADLQPDKRMIHAGRPTTRGEKWIVTQFIRSRPTR
jgi:prolyl 4-hydroxylase